MMLYPHIYDAPTSFLSKNEAIPSEKWSCHIIFCNDAISSFVALMKLYHHQIFYSATLKNCTQGLWAFRDFNDQFSKCTSIPTFMVGRGC